jgi:hypothetical protein
MKTLILKNLKYYIVEMSYYDSSTLTKRKQNKVISNDFLNRLNSNNLSYGPTIRNFIRFNTQQC